MQCRRYSICSAKKITLRFALSSAIFSSFTFTPYMDGNGRIGRFLMNVMMAAGGYPWIIMPVGVRSRLCHGFRRRERRRRHCPVHGVSGRACKASTGRISPAKGTRQQPGEYGCTRRVRRLRSGD